jgi:hypothetical protein
MMSIPRSAVRITTRLRVNPRGKKGEAISRRLLAVDAEPLLGAGCL